MQSRLASPPDVNHAPCPHVGYPASKHPLEDPTTHAATHHAEYAEGDKNSISMSTWYLARLTRNSLIIQLRRDRRKANELKLQIRRAEDRLVNLHGVNGEDACALHKTKNTHEMYDEDENLDRVFKPELGRLLIAVREQLYGKEGETLKDDLEGVVALIDKAYLFGGSKLA